jgi:hypothetical protein
MAVGSLKAQPPIHELRPNGVASRRGAGDLEHFPGFSSTIAERSLRHVLVLVDCGKLVRRQSDVILAPRSPMRNPGMPGCDYAWPQLTAEPMRCTSPLATPYEASLFAAFSAATL